MQETTKKPAIRFAGYNDAWEQRKFSEIVETRRGLTYKPSDICENGVRVLRSSNIDDDSFVLRDDDVFVKAEAVNIDYTKENDILITAANGSSRLVGKHAIIGQVSPKSTVHGGFMLLGATKEPYFVNASMSSSWYRHFIELFVAGGNGTIGNINKNDLDNQGILVPSEEERQKIGAFFKQLDHLITLHQRKYSMLMNIKKSMLEKMFPRNGAKVPEIRFAGFTDAWEQRKLGEVASSFEYGLNAAAKEFDGVNKYLRITDIDDSSRVFKDDDLTSPDTDLSTAGGYQLHDGEILFARTGASVGKSFIYRESDGLVYYAGFLIRAKVKPEYDSEFIFQNTLGASYEKYIQITSQRSGQPGVNAQEYAEYTFLVPDYTEQKKIGGFLRQIDNLITLHQRELERLQNIKKSCLEKMFV